MAWIAVLLLSLHLSVQAFYSPAVPFYRDPHSPFPSGQTDPDVLEKNRRGPGVTQNFYDIRKDRKETSLEAGQVLRDLDLSLKAEDISSQEIGLIAQARSPWYEWISPNGRRFWKSAKDLVPVPDDLGLAQVISAHEFRQTPDENSEPLFHVNIGDRYRVLGFKQGYVHVASVTDPELRGFLQLRRVILKIDFASYVMGEHGSWRNFSYREDGDAVLQSRDRLALNHVRALLTQPDRGVVSRDLPDQGLVPRSVVELRKAEWVRWARSELPGHGLVYWKEQEHLNDPASDLIPTDQLLRRNFTWVAVHPKNPHEALVSGHGVFWTHDGQKWKRLPHFQNEDLPVAINSRGDLFVGTFFSRDDGKTFRPFLRWEDLTPLIESQHRRIPGVLKLAEVRTPSPDQVEIRLDTGAGKIRLLGSNRYGLVTDWKIVDTSN